MFADGGTSTDKTKPSSNEHPAAPSGSQHQRNFDVVIPCTFPGKILYVECPARLTTPANSTKSSLTEPATTSSRLTPKTKDGELRMRNAPSMVASAQILSDALPCHSLGSSGNTTLTSAALVKDTSECLSSKKFKHCHCALLQVAVSAGIYEVSAQIISAARPWCGMIRVALTTAHPIARSEATAVLTLAACATFDRVLDDLGDCSPLPWASSASARSKWWRIECTVTAIPNRQGSARVVRRSRHHLVAVTPARQQ
jgi:hypothetical protein